MKHVWFAMLLSQLACCPAAEISRVPPTLPSGVPETPKPEAGRAFDDLPKLPAFGEGCGGHYRVALDKGISREAADEALLWEIANECPLAPFARLRLARKSAPSEAVRKTLTGISESLACYSEVELLRAESEGDPEHFRLLLGRPLSGELSSRATLGLARALSRSGLTKETGEETLRLGRNLSIQAPTFHPEEVRALLEKARDAVPQQDNLLSPHEQALRAEALLLHGATRQAMTAAHEILSNAGAPASARCKASLVSAKAKSEPPSWERAVHECSGTEDEPHALFQMAKSLAKSGESREAMVRYSQIEKRFPKHRLADDARLRTATLVRRVEGDAAGDRLLDSMRVEYPDGDMHEDAACELAVRRWMAHDLAGARAAVETRDTIPAHAQRALRGRARYLFARLSELLGDTASATQGFRELADGAPSYYWLLSRARLSALRSALPELPRPPAEELRFFSSPRSEWATPSATLGLALLSVGDFELARTELALLEKGDPELRASVGHAYAKAGLFDVAHRLGSQSLDELAPTGPFGRGLAAYQVAYPRAYEATVREIAGSESVPPELVWAIMREESGFVPDIASVAGAEGLMQLMRKTAQELARGTGYEKNLVLSDPKLSIALGTKFLRTLAQNLPLPLAVAAYNAGSGAVKRFVRELGEAPMDLFVESIPYEETRGYVRRVLASMAIYAMLEFRPLGAITAPFER